METMIVIKNDMTTYIDCDETLVLWDGDKYTPNEKMITQLKQHKARNHPIIVWSAGGWEWAARVVKELGLEEYVDLVIAKPRFYWDDKLAAEFMPKTMRYYVK